MTNELILLADGILATAFVILAWRINRERLYSAIIIFLILIAIAGDKTISVLGHITNTGNVLYAAAFLATYFIIERYGKQEALRSISIGIICVGMFALLLYLAMAFIPAPGAEATSERLSGALAHVPRIALASLIAYLLSQSINVFLYTYLKQSYSSLHVWWRANVSNAVAQVIDSAVFFIVAFAAAVPFGILIDMLLTGFVIKVVYMMLAAPFLALNRLEEDQRGAEFSITMWPR